MVLIAHLFAYCLFGVDFTTYSVRYRAGSLKADVWSPAFVLDDQPKVDGCFGQLV